MQGMNKKNRNSEFSYLLEVTQRVSRKTGSRNKVVTSSLFLSLASLGGKCLTGFYWSSNYFHSYEKKTYFLHLPVFQRYLYQTAMEPLSESSSLQIGPSSSEMVAQDYELIVISGNCERRMLQRTWWTCVLCKKALMLTEVWVFHQTKPFDQAGWRAGGHKFKKVGQAELKKGPFVIVIRQKSPNRKPSYFLSAILLTNT